MSDEKLSDLQNIWPGATPSPARLLAEKIVQEIYPSDIRLDTHPREWVEKIESLLQAEIDKAMEKGCEIAAESWNKVKEHLIAEAEKEAYEQGHKEGVLSATLDWKAKTKEAYEEGLQAGLKIRDKDVKLISECNSGMMKESYLDAAKIAEEQGCYHNQGACGPMIAAKLRQKAGE